MNIIIVILSWHIQYFSFCAGLSPSTNLNSRLNIMTTSIFIADAHELFLQHILPGVHIWWTPKQWSRCLILYLIACFCKLSVMLEFLKFLDKPGLLPKNYYIDFQFVLRPVICCCNNIYTAIQVLFKSFKQLQRGVTLCRCEELALKQTRCFYFLFWP